ncbi:MAG: hypothetical protein ACTSWX_02225 [Promethearchaeota archaeon]
MVQIKFDEKNPYKVYVIRNWRDYLDQLKIISIFATGLLVIAIYLNITNNNSKIFYYIWPFICFLLLIYYLMPKSKTTLDLEKNQWNIRKYIIIPIKTVGGQISSLSKIIATENIDERKKFKFSLKKAEYYSDLSFLELKNNDKIRKHKLYSHKTYSFNSHKFNTIQNEKIGSVLENFFQNLNLSIEFEKSVKHFKNTKI